MIRDTIFWTDKACSQICKKKFVHEINNYLIFFSSSVNIYLKQILDNLIYNVLTCYNTGEDTQSMCVIHPFDIKAFIPTKHRKILLLTSVRVSKRGDNPFKVFWIVIEMVRFTVRFWTCTDFLILKIALISQTRQWISLIIIRKL